MKKYKESFLHIRIPGPLLIVAKQLADKNDMNLSEYIRYLIHAEMIKENERKKGGLKNNA